MKLRKILSAVLTAAMLFGAAPAVFAEGEAPAVPLSEPTAERIFCAVNDMVDDIYGNLMTEPVLEYATIEDGGDPIKLSDFVNEDGTFTEAALAAVEEMLQQEIAAGTITEEELEGLELPGDIYGTFEFVTGIVHAFVTGMLEGFEATEELAAFTADYPDGIALHAHMMETCFAENDKPSVEEMLYFIAGDSMIIDGEGYLMIEHTEFVSDGESWLITVPDLIAPTGAYLQPSEEFGNSRNVYAQLKAAWEAGEIGNEEAFAILTGYIPDLSGDLYTVTPVYSYLRDENGNRLTDVLDIVGEDGTVLDTGLSVIDYSVKRAVEYYESTVLTEDGIGAIAESGFEEFLYGVLEKYISGEVPDTSMTVTPEEYEAMIREEIDGFAEELGELDGTEEDLWYGVLWGYAGIDTDAFGYVYDSYADGYAYNADGGKVNIADIMDGEGKFLTDEYGAATVAELMEAYLAEMSTEALLKGDITDDGKVGLTDVSVLLQSVAGWDVDINDAAADANGDGKVNMTDITLMLQYIAAWDVEMVY